MKGIEGALKNPEARWCCLFARRWLRPVTVTPLIAVVLVGLLITTPHHVHAYTSSGPQVVSGGTGHGIAVRTDGSVWAWGVSNSGALGSNASAPSPSPVQVPGLPSAAAVAAGQDASYAIDSSGNVWAWGDNYYGELGQGQAASSGCYCSSTPLKVLGLTDVTAIAAGSDFALALEGNGNVWAWGYNDDGELGLGFTSTSSSDCDCVAAPVVVPGLTGVTAIAVAMYHSLALRSDGTVWAWGWNSTGQLGNGTTTDSASPIEVPGLPGIGAIGAGGGNQRYAFSLAVAMDGSVWAWGANPYGELGQGNTTTGGCNCIASPVAVPGLPTIVMVAPGEGHTIALDASGGVWGWGKNDWGQLGTGSATTAGCQCLSSPSRVTGLSNVTGLAAGGAFSFAVESDGSLWSWGENFDGELAQGSADNYYNPHPTPAASQMTGVAQGSGGATSCVSAPTVAASPAIPVGLNLATASDATLAAAGLAAVYPTITALEDGGSLYMYTVAGHVERAAYPPATFNPLTASAGALEEYGLPPRPGGGVALQQWTQLFSGATFAQPATRLIMVPNESTTSVGTPTGACLYSSTTVTNVRTPIWAGYVNHHAANAYTDAGVAYTEPTTTSSVPCGAEAVSIWAGIGGYGSASVIQDGTLSSDPAEGWSHLVWYEDYPDAAVSAGTNISAGDYVDAVVHYNSTTGNATYIVKDVTTNQIVLSKQVPAPHYNGDTAEYIVERPGKTNGPGNFNLLDFSDIAMNHAYWGTSNSVGFVGSGANPTQIQMTSSDLMASTSGLSNNDGNANSAFTVTHHSCT